MKHTIKGYITHERWPNSIKPSIGFTTYRPSKEYWPHMVVVREHSFEIEVPDDFDPRPDLIAGLKAQQQKAAADYQKLCTDIQRQISELQALEFKA